MLRHAGVGIVIGIVMSLLGVSFTDITEFATVAKIRTEKLVDDAIPISVKIDRMAVILDKMDAQVKEQAMVVAKGKVAAETAQADLEETQKQLNQLLSEMRQLRSECENTSTLKPVGQSLVQALGSKLASYRNLETLNAAKSKAVEAQRRAYEELSKQFVDWQNKRQLLGYQIETLRARYTAQQLSDSANVDVFSDADLSRATKLAEDVGEIISLNEVQRSLLMSPQEMVTPGPSIEAPEDAAKLLQDIDALLGVSITDR
jgi:predicted RNase H-like nuclease (RuvC/YqgF family)